jgi:hypothetical protein
MKKEKERLQTEMKRAERGLAAVPPGAFGTPGASTDRTCLTFTVKEDDDSDEDLGSDDGRATPVETFPPPKKRPRIRKGLKPPPDGDANFDSPSICGVPFSISFENVSEEMDKLKKQIMGHDLFKENFTNANKRDKREELSSLYQAIEHHKKMRHPDRVNKLVKRADELEKEMFRI